MRHMTEEQLRDLNSTTRDLIIDRIHQKAQEEMRAFRVNEIVELNIKGMAIDVVIDSLNSKSVTVTEHVEKPEPSTLRFRKQWRVSPSLLSKKALRMVAAG
ncbi:MAG: hypothetical protein V1799_07680 [bacterium]